MPQPWCSLGRPGCSRRQEAMVPAGRVLAMELLRLSPPRPWLFNSSHADVITMESEAMWDYYGAAGMPATQMVVTGSTADDVMAGVCLLQHHIFGFQIAMGYADRVCGRERRRQIDEHLRRT